MRRIRRNGAASLRTSVYEGKLYLVQLGHFTAGWRQFGDWSVNFSQVEDGKRVQRASFAVGMQKGQLASVQVDGVTQ